MSDAPAWQESIDPALLAQLMRPLVSPGIVSPAIARRILGWVEYFSGRLPMLEEIRRRHGRGGGLRVNEVPIVHGRRVMVDAGGALPRAVAGSPQERGSAAGSVIAPVNATVVASATASASAPVTASAPATASAPVVAPAPAAASAPVPVTLPAPVPVTVPVAVPAPVPVAVTVPVTVPAPAPVAAPVVAPAPVPAPAPVIAPASAVAPLTNAISHAVTTAAPAPAPGHAPASATMAEAEPALLVVRAAPVRERALLPGESIAMGSAPPPRVSPVQGAPQTASPRGLPKAARGTSSAGAAPPEMRRAERPIVSPHTRAVRPGALSAVGAREPAAPALPARPERPVVAAASAARAGAMPASPPDFAPPALPPRDTPVPIVPMSASTAVATPDPLPHVRLAGPATADASGPPQPRSEGWADMDAAGVGPARGIVRAAPSTAAPWTAIPGAAAQERREAAPPPPQAAPAPQAAPVDLELLADRVQKRLLRRIAAERERKGGGLG